MQIGKNMNIVRLPADPLHDLHWEASSEGIYHLDFGWEKLNLIDPSLFQANFLAVEEFGKRFPDAEKVILARSDGTFPIDVQVFSEYLHRLASALPEETTPVILFDLDEGCPFASLVLKLCRRRFEHFELLFSGVRIPIVGEESIIVSLPQDSLYDEKTFQPLFSRLEGTPFKCIPEELLNEHWEGVDQIMVERSTLGEMGKRMLQGFEATEGEISWL
ncbi:MAG: hypothetical protein K1000chlam2_01029 [Chlamydiae bacterium]|nr:hypothetical protein [Chlamydiota bacterium]